MSRRPFLAVALLVAAASAAGAQSSAHATLTAEQQIVAAVQAMPAHMHDGATVLGYRDGKLTTLRKGTNQMTCLAPDPKRAEFHVACYHDGMEPFMARGRELRASGTTGAQVDTVRYAEVKSGKLALPKLPASLYTLTGGSFDPATGKVTGAGALYVVYVPYATSATTGISDKPSRTSPWLMFPGTPKAHIMIVGSM
jgi:hypothetical protein